MRESFKLKSEYAPAGDSNAKLRLLSLLRGE